MEAEAKIQFALSEQEQEDLRWYLEDYLQHAEVAEAVHVQQVEALMKALGEELYTKVLPASGDTQALWFPIATGSPIGVSKSPLAWPRPPPFRGS